MNMNNSAQQILDVAQQQAQAKNLQYFGDVTPDQAWTLLQSVPGAVMVDVRTDAERDFVGVVPGAIPVSWKIYPGMVANPDFLGQVQKQVGQDQLVLTLCRSGVRSVDAAIALTAAGYGCVLNILEGFEGDKNAAGQRVVNGWKQAGLPWSQ